MESLNFKSAYFKISKQFVVLRIFIKNKVNAINFDLTTQFILRNNKLSLNYS
ncbi:hypothetical protein LEP1GSC041_3839 [Leptospira noguchii str. 2006001870]|nr:hypothetical protein LEP1GSC041_3839 [Leptospira noguchii str. 2006001870]